MAEVYEQMAGSAAFVPTDEDRASVAAWFARYDALAAKVDLEAMADQAVFPLNVVTDSTSAGSAEQWTRERFIETMGAVMGDSGEVSMDSTRHPIFLSANLAFVVTDATMTIGDQSHAVRYADLLVKIDGGWRFQTMVQSGFGT